ncbi:matrixin family metalloprotease [Saccharomonospora saliphila]|uniref:matrixin family metalloprotease n=1 Tax=Saccharomonospora saliphila TaxID=369829 RepID=UPI0003603685|nr:matrixin family metalloprotease [Saccharomonospora saliphila]
MPKSTRLLTLTLAALTAAALPVAQLQPAHAEQPPSPPGLEWLCEGGGPIPAAELVNRVVSPACSLVGRMVTGPADTRGLNVRVPEPGELVRAFAVKPGGSEVLTVSNLDGEIRTEFDDTADGADTADTADTAHPDDTAHGARGTEARHDAVAGPCEQSAYAFNHGGRGFPSLRWYYNSGSAARAGLSVAGAREAIVRANRTMTDVRDDCGLPRPDGRARSEYLGDTRASANIDSGAGCTSGFPDGDNTVSWGPFDSGLNYLALTCTMSSSATEQIYEADIYLASNRNLTLDLPKKGCSRLWDVEAVATHEWGHAFGLGHVDEETNGDLTMSPAITSCDTSARTLGLGDHRGLDALYGAPSQPGSRPGLLDWVGDILG